MTRLEAVQALVRFEQPLEALRAALAELPWDWDGPALAFLSAQTVASVLQRYDKGELTAEQVNAWANLVELREDIGFDAVSAGAIFDLANPELQGQLPDIAPGLLARL